MFRDTRLTVRLGLLAACWAAVLSATPASAQDRAAGRLYRGLFGPDERNAAQVLSVNGAVGAGYETDVIAEQRDRNVNIGNASFLRSDDVFGLFAGGVFYSDYTDSRDLRASAMSVARNYSQFATVASHHAAGSMMWRLGRRTTVSGIGDITYQPWGALIYSPPVTDPAFGQVVAPTRQIPVLNGSYTVYASRGGITQQLSRRSSLAASYGYDVANFSGLSGDFRHQEASIRYMRTMTRNLGWHLGYSYSNARYVGEQIGYDGRTIDVGLDYSRNLSLTRRTRFGFSTGVSGFADSSAIRPTDNEGTRYIATGSAWLSREVGRTWDAVLTYNRNVAFFETLRVPYVYDGVSIGISGLISRRVWLRSSVAATLGDTGFAAAPSESNRLVTGIANTSLVIALSRYAAIATDYTFSAYALDDATAFWGGYLPDVTRHSVVVSVRAWAPLLERGRRGNATR